MLCSVILRVVADLTAVNENNRYESIDWVLSDLKNLDKNVHVHAGDAGLLPVPCERE